MAGVGHLCCDVSSFPQIFLSNFLLHLIKTILKQKVVNLILLDIPNQKFKIQIIQNMVK